MARASASERSGAFYRADTAAREPPRDLSQRAKAIWREIVRAKPIDWFDGGSVGLLADHCETQARLEQCWVVLRRLPAGCDDARVILAEVKILRPNFGRSAALLRLPVQYAVERQAAKAGEKAPEAQGEALIGGQAAARFKVVGG
jgi:hypothetical protein